MVAVSPTTTTNAGELGPFWSGFAAGDDPACDSGGFAYSEEEVVGFWVGEDSLAEGVGVFGEL